MIRRNFMETWYALRGDNWYEAYGYVGRSIEIGFDLKTDQRYYKLADAGLQYFEDGTVVVNGAALGEKGTRKLRIVSTHNGVTYDTGLGVITTADDWEGFTLTTPWGTPISKAMLRGNTTAMVKLLLDYGTGRAYVLGNQRWSARSKHPVNLKPVPLLVNNRQATEHRRSRLKQVVGADKLQRAITGETLAPRWVSVATVLRAVAVWKPLLDGTGDIAEILARPPERGVMTEYLTVSELLAKETFLRELNAPVRDKVNVAYLNFTTQQNT